MGIPVFESHDRLHCHTLTRTRFTDNADNLPIANSKTHVIHYGTHSRFFRKSNG